MDTDEDIGIRIKHNNNIAATILSVSLLGLMLAPRIINYPSRYAN
jgi:hypothetical protein